MFCIYTSSDNNSHYVFGQGGWIIGERELGEHNALIKGGVDISWHLFRELQMMIVR